MRYSDTDKINIVRAKVKTSLNRIRERVFALINMIRSLLSSKQPPTPAQGKNILQRIRNKLGGTNTVDVFNIVDALRFISEVMWTGVKIGVPIVGAAVLYNYGKPSKSKVFNNTKEKINEKVTEIIGNAATIVGKGTVGAAKGVGKAVDLALGQKLSETGWEIDKDKNAGKTATDILFEKVGNPILNLMEKNMDKKQSKQQFIVESLQGKHGPEAQKAARVEYNKWLKNREKEIAKQKKVAAEQAIKNSPSYKIEQMKKELLEKQRRKEWFRQQMDIPTFRKWGNAVKNSFVSAGQQGMLNGRDELPKQLKRLLAMKRRKRMLDAMRYADRYLRTTT